MIRFVFLVTLLLTSVVVNAESMQSQALSDLVFYPQRSAPAEVVAKHDSLLTVEVKGVVDALMVDVGDQVERGAPLLRLNDYDYRQAVKQSEATLQGIAARIELAQYQLEQAQRLAKQQNISDELQRQRRAELKGLKAERLLQQSHLAVAKNNLEKSVLRAPFDGVVVERQAQLGQLANPGGGLFRLVSVTGQQVAADLSHDDAEQLQHALDLKFQFNGRLFKLGVDSVISVVHNQQRTRKARLDFVGEVAPVGGSGRLVWQDLRPYLPAKYLVRRDGQLGVMAMNEQNEPSFLSLPQAQEGRAVIVEQLSLDTQILLDE